MALVLASRNATCKAYIAKVEREEMGSSCLSLFLILKFKVGDM